MGSDVRRGRGQGFRRLGVGLVVSLMGLAGFAPIASSVEVGPTGNPTVLQTNGPNNPVHNGDFYAATGLPDLLEIDIPCSWPSTWPLVVDLFSAEIQSTSVNDEIVGAMDDTRFVLTDPNGVVVADTTYSPNSGVEDYDRLVTLLPAACGVYFLEITVSDDDQAGYKVRVGTDDDGDPNTAPPGGYDDVDGIPSTGDEITIGLTRASLQQDSGGVVCLPFFEYVQPGLASIALHNFDLDDAGSIAYYPPSTDQNLSSASLVGLTAPPVVAGMINGTGSSFTEWNLGTGSGLNAERGGDIIPTPEDGWWTVVVCVTNNNQFIFEAQEGVPLYFERPAMPVVTLEKDDGLASVSVGQEYTYVIDYANSDDTPTPMDIESVLLTDPLPAGLSYLSCAMSDPSLTCSYDAASHTVTSNVGFLASGSGGTLEVTVSVDAAMVGPVVNEIELTYLAIGTNVFKLLAEDINELVDPPTAPVLSIVKDDGLEMVGAGETTTYVIDVVNTTTDDAQSVVITDPAVAGVTFADCRVITAPAGATCSIGTDGDVTANLGTLPGSGTAQIEIDAVLGDTVTDSVDNTATVSWTNDSGDDLSLSDNDLDTVTPALLPFTGTNLISPLLKLALGLVVIGIAAVAASTSRRSTTPA